MAVKHRCIYCRKITASDYTVRWSAAEEYHCCSAACQRRAERYFRFCRWGIPVFLALTLVSLGLLLATALGFSENEDLTLAGLGLFGLSLAALPFPTGTTVERWGIRRSNLVLRILGGVVALTALGLAAAIRG